MSPSSLSLHLLLLSSHLVCLIHSHFLKRVSLVCAGVRTLTFPHNGHTLQRVPPDKSRLLFYQPKIPDCLGHTIQIGEIKKQRLCAPRIQGMPLESICFMLRWQGEGAQGGERIFRFFFFSLSCWTIGIIHFKLLPHIVLLVDHTQRGMHKLLLSHMKKNAYST